MEMEILTTNNDTNVDGEITLETVTSFSITGTTDTERTAGTYSDVTFTHLQTVAPLLVT